jgi:uncharacterized membrane protein
MNPSTILFLAALGIGVISGLRSLTTPAAVSWAAHLHWIDPGNTPMAFLAATATVYGLSALAIFELIADKLPFTPRRTIPPAFAARILTGAFSAAALYVCAHQPIYTGAAIGAVGAVAGTLGGYHARHWLVKSLNVPDILVALAEDTVDVGGAMFLVSRF